MNIDTLTTIETIVKGTLKGLGQEEEPGEAYPLIFAMHEVHENVVPLRLDDMAASLEGPYFGSVVHDVYGCAKYIEWGPDGRALLGGCWMPRYGRAKA